MIVPFLLQEILREGSGFLAGDELTVACDIDVHADACPIFEGLLGIKHCMHDVALVVEGHKVYANKAVCDVLPLIAVPVPAVLFTL